MKEHKTPSLFHYHNLGIETHPEVYDPAEDSFLLLESVHVNPTDTVLELGTGCGLIALACAQLGARVVCTDINPHAVQLTKKNIIRNQSLLKGNIEVRTGDLFSVIKRDEHFTVIIFNPPYLPTAPHKKKKDWPEVAVDGGTDGLQLIKRFIHEATHHLGPHGRLYFVFSSLADRVSLEHILEDHGFTYEILAGYVFDGEHLDVYGAMQKH